jgi:hypothetical protein
MRRSLEDRASAHPRGRRKHALPYYRLLSTLLLVLVWGTAAVAIPLKEYRERVLKAIASLDLLHETEDSSHSLKDEIVTTNIRAARESLVFKETVEWDGAKIQVDNSWLEEELKRLEQLSAADVKRSEGLERVLERLQAIAERLAEIEQTRASPAVTRAELNQRLAAILHRPEYARTPKKESALSRLWIQFWRWITSLFPQRAPLNPSAAKGVSRIAQIFVLAIALASIVYVVRKFLPRLLRSSQAKKASKPRARVVLGERLEPDQSAADLLAEAEDLARAGDLRGAIRRGYIALLVELADRKIISLAQHKTNRDYLGAVREIQGLHRNMETLTNNYEQHWYGFVPAEESDWAAFRAGYKQVSSFESRLSS